MRDKRLRRKLEEEGIDYIMEHFKNPIKIA
jgi:hypothetical protein